MTSSGFDWLSLPADRSVEHSLTPPPPHVSFGLSSNSTIAHSSSEGSLTEKRQAAELRSREQQQQQQAQQQQQQKAAPEIDFKNLFGDMKKPVSEIQLNADHSKANDKDIDVIDSKAKEEEVMKNFRDDPAIPLSLSVEQLTAKEQKTYLRWYNDIITRRGTRTITLVDVFKFLNNFRIAELHKKLIQKIFASCAHSLNVGQFFCVLRIISHAVVYHTLPSRELIKRASPIPTPVSILARKRVKESDEDEYEDEIASPEGSKLNLDTFAQFMLTGHRPDSPAQTTIQRKKKNMKKVKFSDTVEIDPRSAEAPPAPQPPPVVSDKIDFSLPMEQLLGKIGSNNGVTTPPQQAENEEEELKDMQDAINHFQNVHIDSVSIDGVPSNIPSNYFSHSPMVASPQRENSSSPQLLQPNLTGSVSKSMRQGLGITSPPPPPPRIRSVSSPVPFENQLAVPTQSLQYAHSVTSPRLSSPLSSNNNNSAINWQPSPSPTSMAPPPPPPRFRSSTVPGNVSQSPAPPPPRARKNSNAALSTPPPALLYQQPTGPELPPKIEVGASPAVIGFDDFFKNGNIYKSNSDLSVNQLPQNNNTTMNGSGHMNVNVNGGANGNVAGNSSSDILGDLKALKAEVDRIKYMSGSGGY